MKMQGCVRLLLIVIFISIICFILTYDADAKAIEPEEDIMTIIDIREGITIGVLERVQQMIEEIKNSKPEYPKLYTEEDAIALAKMVWGEARGVPHNGTVSGDCQRAATIWCVLNRFDEGYAKTIKGVVTAPYQFTGYRSSNPVTDEHLELAYDVLDRWNREKHGETDVGRVLPQGYCFFRGDGRYNIFRDAYKNGDIYTWYLEDVYGDCFERNADE